MGTRRPLLSVLIFLALAVHSARAFDYFMLGPPGGSFKSVEYVREGMLLAGGFNGRLYLSQDYANTWKDITPTNVTRGMVVEQILYHSPTDSIYLIARDLKRGILVRATRTQFLEGLNKHEILLPELPIRSLALSEDDPPRIYVGTDERLHYSMNGGRSWKAASSQMPNPQVESLAIDPDVPDTIYAGSWQRPYKTTDFGKTWQPIHAGMAPDSDVFVLFFDARKQMWAGTCGHAYQSTTRGKRWIKKRIGLKGKRIHCITQLKTDGDGDVLAGTDNGLHVFRHKADAWMQVVSDVVVQDITQDETGTVFIATEGAGIIQHNLVSHKTRQMNQGLNASSPRAIAGSPEKTLWTGLMYQGNASGLWQYSSDNWHKLTIENNGHNIRDLVSTSKYLFAASSNGLIRFTLNEYGHETGETLRFLKGKTVKSLYLESDGVTVLAGAFDGVYQVNTETNHEAHYPGTHEINVNCLWKCPDTGLLFAGAEGALYRLDPGQAQWKPSKLPVKSARINKIAGTHDGSQIYLATSHGVMASYDKGQRFTRATGDLPSGACLDICIVSGLKKEGQVIKNTGSFEEGQVIALMSNSSIYTRLISAYTWNHLETFPFDVWSLHPQHDNRCLLVGSPANGVIQLDLSQ